MISRGKKILRLVKKDSKYTESSRLDEICVFTENHNLKVPNANVSDSGKLNLSLLNEIQYITMQLLLASIFQFLDFLIMFLVY